jgi:hypothetical protein
MAQDVIMRDVHVTHLSVAQQLPSWICLDPLLGSVSRSITANCP